MKLRTPCIDCGVPVKATRCEDCSKKSERLRIRSGRRHSRKASPKERGYDEKWRRLSERARRLQPFCSDCGETSDLQADHSPEAWERYEKGLPLRLADIDVVCGPCNRKRGAARGDKRRSKASNPHDGPGPHTRGDRRSGGHTDPGEGPLAGHRPYSSRGPTLHAITLSHSETMIPGGGK